MGIEERWREPRRGVAEVVPFAGGARSERGVSRSLRNWALFMFGVEAGAGVTSSRLGKFGAVREGNCGVSQRWDTTGDLS